MTTATRQAQPATRQTGRTGLREALPLAGLALLMFGLTLGTVAVEHWSGRFVAVWPMNAVMLTYLLRTPPRRWTAAAAAGLAGNMVANLVLGQAPPVAMDYGLSNTGEVLICAVALRRLLGRDIDLARYRDLAIFGLVAGLAGPLFSMVLTILRRDPRVTAFGADHLIRWLVADSLGYILFVPALLILTPRTLQALVTRRRGLPLVILGLFALLVVAAMVQGSPPMRYLLAPALMFVIFQLEAPGAALGMLIMGVISAGFALEGVGPNGGPGAHVLDRVMVLQLNLLITALSAYPIAAVLTQRARLSETLVASLGRLETAKRLTGLAEQVGGVGYWWMDAATGAMTCSDGFYRIFDLPKGSIGSLDSFLTLLEPEERELRRTQIAQAIADGGEIADVIRVMRAGGEWRSVRGRAACEFDGDGKVTAVLGTIFDITEIALADEALRASETRYRLLAENSTDMIAVTDRDGRLSYLSPSSVTATGFLPEELLGRTTAELMRPEDARRAEIGRRALFETPSLTNLPPFCYRARHKDGRWCWFETRTTIMRDPATGEATGLLDVVRDVTARMALEAELQRKAEEAQAATVAKTEFLANMSHEIRTPLTGIIGFSDLLGQIDGLPADAERYVRRIRTAGGALLSVVNDVLDFSKLEAGQLALDVHPFETAAFVRETVELVAAQAAQKGLALETRFAGPLPAWVEADSGRVRQVLLNLLSNAIKFTQTGEVEVEVAYLAERGGALTIRVKDTGAGIAEDRRDRLFQRFSQVDSTISRSHGGTGLGLAISRHLTELMGGAIGVESVEGEGSTFWFSIAAPAVEAPADAQALDATDDDGRPARILIVDDVAANRELVRAMLTPFGHEFEEAENGIDAVRLAMKSSFDLILMDMQMPGMDGLAASRSIRASAELNWRTPIVALSANVLPAEVAACMAAGMDDHIAKPIRPLDLLTKVSQWAGAERPDQKARSV